MILTLDVANLEVIPSKAQTALSYFGRVDILINNAGQSYRGLGTDTEIDVHMKLMTVNYFGQIALTKGKLTHVCYIPTLYYISYTMLRR